MKLRTLALTLASLLSFTMSAPARAQKKPDSQIIAIKAGKLIDPETGQTASDQSILVDGKMITNICPNLTIPSNAKIVDLSKSTVLPGLFDAHTHLCMTVIPERDANNYYITTLLDPTPYRAIQGV